MKQLSLVMLLILTCAPCLAQDAQTRREFLLTRNEMVEAIKAKDKVVESRERQLSKLVATQSLAGETYGKKGRIYYLTQGGHYAHPSIMVVQLLERDGAYIVQRSGTTGTSRILFDKWLSQMRWRDENDMNEILGIALPPEAAAPAPGAVAER